ncbi:MAG: glycosyl transferase family 90 [Pseudomonadota bacterium]
MNEASPPRWLRRTAALGLIEKLETATFQVDGRGEGLLVHAGMDEAAFKATLPQYQAGRRFLKFGEAMRSALYRNYVAPVVAVAEELGHERPFQVWAGDNRRSFPVPLLTRSRALGHPGLCVLQRIHLKGHAPDTLHVTSADIPFADKEDRLVWRGATTGKFFCEPGELDFGPRYFVAPAQDRIDDGRIDIGFSSINQQRKMSPQTVKAVRAAKRSPLSVEEMLGARYLLSLEGNDVATNLAWALHSNSCVLMPKPTCESWLSEAMLTPYVHYVPVAANLSNLKRMFAWCQNHPKECEEIATAGRAFIKPFHDEAAERKLSMDVAAIFFARIKLIPAKGAELPEGVFP